MRRQKCMLAKIHALRTGSDEVKVVVAIFHVLLNGPSGVWLVAGLGAYPMKSDDVLNFRKLPRPATTINHRHHRLETRHVQRGL